MADIFASLPSQPKARKGLCKPVQIDDIEEGEIDAREGSRQHKALHGTFDNWWLSIVLNPNLVPISYEVQHSLQCFQPKECQQSMSDRKVRKISQQVRLTTKSQPSSSL